MLTNIFKSAIQGYRDIKTITKPITQTVKVGLSSAGVIKLTPDEENEIIEQLMIEELIKQQEQQPNYQKSDSPMLPRANLSKTDTLYHLPRLTKNSLQYVLGYRENGELIIEDLTNDKHLLVAGATGSGKSVSLFNILVCLTAMNSPKTLKISLIDPKILSFGDKRITNSPFLTMSPSIGDNKTAYQVLSHAYNDMMKRYSTMREHGAKDYKKIGIPAHVIFIDEVYELLSGEHTREIINLITKIASLGRQAGVHLVMATQSPRAEILSGVLKANLKTIGHRVENKTESTILGLANAHLLSQAGEGYKNIGGEPVKFQATYIDIDSDYIYRYITPNAPIAPNAPTTPKAPKALTQSTDIMGSSNANDFGAMGATGIVELNLNSTGRHKEIREKILESADNNYKIAPKKNLINPNIRQEVRDYERAIKELIAEDIIYFVNGKGYYIKDEK